MSPSFSCGHLFYRSSVVRLDLHIEVILMRIAQLYEAFPLTLHPYDRLVHDAGNTFEWRKIRRIYHAWSQAVDRKGI
ncbi:hypothetical protein B0H14DRAFT_3480980 [Mycena olivaceomarginata]|nr:hypothetical protein B0H14DRAFT_3480980 [Mycena olivaceomarginata]